MAATFDWQCDHGSATGSPAKGTTRSTGVANNNYKAADDEATTYSSAPIQDGNNSYERFLFGKFTGTFNLISSVLWAHTSGTLGAGLTLKGFPSVTNDANRPLYTTPSQTANSNLSVDMTTAIAIGSGVAVLLGATGPEATGKAATGSGDPLYTTYLPTQLQVSGASPGDTATITSTLQYNES